MTTNTKRDTLRELDDAAVHRMMDYAAKGILTAKDLGRIRDYLRTRLATPAPTTDAVDSPIDAADNVEYVRRCADKLEAFGLRMAASGLRVIAKDYAELKEYYYNGR